MAVSAPSESTDYMSLSLQHELKGLGGSSWFVIPVDQVRVSIDDKAFAGRKGRVINYWDDNGSKYGPGEGAPGAGRQGARACNSSPSAALR